jgi:hypothetical protein
MARLLRKKPRKAASVGAAGDGRGTDSIVNIGTREVQSRARGFKRFRAFKGSETNKRRQSLV